MDAIQIQGISAEEFLNRLDERIAGLTRSGSQLSDFLQATIEQSIIDRGFIKRNLKMSYRKIKQYEKDGVLRRIAAVGDTKSCYYRFADYLKLVEKEHAKLHNKAL